MTVPFGKPSVGAVRVMAARCQPQRSTTSRFQRPAPSMSPSGITSQRPWVPWRVRSGEARPLSDNESRIRQVDRRKGVLLRPVVVHVLPFRLVATLGQQVVAARDIARLNSSGSIHGPSGMLWSSGRSATLDARRPVCYVVEQAAHHIGHRSARNVRTRADSEHPGHVRHAGEHHAAIGDGVAEHNSSPSIAKSMSPSALR